ncbi:MAG: hypothetical protein ABJC09_08525 [Terriglobia bacterium]
MSPRAAWRPWMAALCIFAVNVFICRELFAIEFVRNLHTNEGCFVALSRFFREHWNDFRWYPWFNTGMPMENAYQPLLPVLAAVTGAVSGWSPERAFHFVLALAYCGGPVALFWFAWDWSRSLTLSAVAGFAYSLLSPAPLLIPVLGVGKPLRLYNLMFYAEDPHTVALAILPLALLFLRRAILTRRAVPVVAAVTACAAVVLTNVFGGIDLALGGLCVVLSLNGGLGVLVLTGVLGWLWISPWLPPSLINHIRLDQWTPTPHAALNWTVVLALFALLWYFTRRLASLNRFAILFAFWMCVIPLAFFWWNVVLVPQGNRYQLELEMALALALACVCRQLPWRPVVLAALAVAGIWQTVVFRHAAKGLIEPIDITQTIEYKSAMWIDRHLPGQRTMLAGDPQFLFNVLSNNPQMSASHDPTAPNWMQRVAVYTIYSGQGAGDRDAEYSIFWLKAFGNQAIYVPGPNSREAFHGVVHPHKFDGVLPVLWHDEDDTIYGVPQRSRSLAHVVPKEAIVTRRSFNGLDLEPARAYVAALDDPLLPLASVTWKSPSQAVVHARLKRGQVVSLQETWAPGWRASAPIHADALGLMVLEPDCVGDCEVTLSFGAGTEAWICRAFGALATLVLISLLAYAKRGKNAVQNLVGAHGSGDAVQRL